MHPTAKLILIIGTIMFIVGFLLASTICHHQAIDHGFAHYNPTNADFEWFP